MPELPRAEQALRAREQQHHQEHPVDGHAHLLRPWAAACPPSARKPLRSPSGSSVRNTAATMLPVVLPRPPATTITTISMLRTYVKLPGLMVS